MLFPAVGLAGVLIGAGAASAGGPSPDGPGPYQSSAPGPLAASGGFPKSGQIAGESPLLTVFQAREAARAGASAAIPIPTFSLADVAAIAPAERAPDVTGPDLMAAADAPEAAKPGLAAIDIPLPAPVPTPANGAVVDPLPIAIEAAIERLIRDNGAANPLGAGDWRRARAAIGAFYAAREYEPVWVDRNGLTAAGRSALAQLGRAEDDGLNLSAFALPADVDANLPPLRLARLETTIAAAVVAYAEQASGSRAPPSRISRIVAVFPNVADPAVALAETASAPDPGARLADFNPPQKGYRDLREQLKRLLEAAPGGGDLQAMANTSDPSASAAGSSLADVDLDAAGPAKSRRDDARRHGKKRPAAGSYTASANAASAFGPFARRRAAILANMEMWRWEPREMGEKRIEVNVADFSVAALDGDTLLLRERAIVGKPDTPTPMFSSVMRYVLINPSWQVPESIIRKEMLPRLADDPDYLTRHGYEVKMVDGRLTVRQPPGRRNALGRIAFMFPNRHSVYLHDTPSRGLFSAESRAFSHGCVRVEEALRLAELVLGGRAGQWPPQRISAAVGGPERTVFLPRPLPIHIEYFTEFVNESGDLTERPDIYGLTQKVVSTLSSQSRD